MNLETNGAKVDINVSWLNPEKIRKIIIIGSKKMLLFDEMNSNEPIKIYNNYVSFLKLINFLNSISINQNIYLKVNLNQLN